MEQPWEKAAREAKEKKELENKYPLLGAKVRRKGIRGWEEGEVVLDNDTQYIKYSEDDLEELLGMSFQVWDESAQEWKD